MTGYLFKQGMQQGSLIIRAENTDKLLKSNRLSPEEKKFIILAREVINFAEKDLGMKTGRNYRYFIRLRRPWITQIVLAAKHDRLESHLYNFPIIGKVPYKGFFDEDDAIAQEKILKAQGLDTYRREVPAFSTAGWLPDPLVSTMFSSEERFVELLFHELTHSNFYFESEADFNEAFASWFGFKAAVQFLKSRPELTSNPQSILELEKRHERQLSLAKVVKEIIARANSFYKDTSLDVETRRKNYFTWIQLRLRSEGFEKLADLEWNNALILSLGTYYELVDPIDRYAQLNNLSAKDFLKKVIDRGSPIIGEILPPQSRK